MQVRSCETLVILITSTGELILYFIVIFFFFHKKKKKSAAGSFLCCFCVALFQLQDCIFQWFELREMESPYGEQYSQEGNPRAYMTMRDYRNLPYQWQQPVERNPNPYRSMREYRDQWMSAPVYNVPSTYIPPASPQYISTPQPPQPPQLISPVEQAILDLTKLVGDVVEEQKKISAQLSQKIDNMENNVNKRIDGFQSEIDQKLDIQQIDQKLDIQQESILKLTNQLVQQEEESPKEEFLNSTMVEEQSEQQPHQELIEDFIELSEGLAESSDMCDVVFQGRTKKKSFPC